MKKLIVLLGSIIVMGIICNYTIEQVESIIAFETEMDAEIEELSGKIEELQTKQAIEALR